jgi:Na+-translocating ferredoxin:NAD+ oxidoreductase RnfD subunit
MQFMNRLTPVVSTSENSLKRLISYHIAVYFMVLVALILQAALGLREFLFGLSQVAIATALSILIVFIAQKIKKQPLWVYRDYLIMLNYGLLTALLIPTESPFYVIITAILFIAVFRLFFEKVFRKNVIHPVLLSILFIHLLFRSVLPISLTMSNIFQESTLSFGPIRFLFGAYQGLTLGSSAFVILIFLWIYLAVAKVVQFKMSVFYLINLLLATLYYYLAFDLSLWEGFTKIILGYSAFMLVFFIAEPTSTPETKEMAWIYSMVAAVLTAWFRIQFDLVEAAIYAVIFAQLLTWILEQFQQRTNRTRSKLVLTSIIILWVIVLLLTFV